MPKNMTRDEYEASQALRVLHFPDPMQKSDIASALQAASFNLSGGGGVLAIRFVDASGRRCDVVLDQALSAELSGHLRNSLLLLDWVDSAGKATLDPTPP